MTEQATDSGENYRVRLDIFEGPLDLLLHLIKKNELDIYDIPISLITRQYLEYLDIMKQLDLDIAGEFLVMAAELTRIKSRMLLPSPPIEEEEEEGPDPREELVRQLLEYQQFKEAAEQLRERNLLGRDTFIRSGDPTEWLEMAEGLEFEPVGLFQLVEAFRQALAETGEEIQEITVDRISVREKIMRIMDRMRGKASLTFHELFDPAAGRTDLIVTFLAVLELIRITVLRVRQEEEFGQLRLFPTVVEDETAGIEDQIRDDYA